MKVDIQNLLKLAGEAHEAHRDDTGSAEAGLRLSAALDELEAEATAEVIKALCEVVVKARGLIERMGNGAHGDQKAALIEALEPFD